MNYMFAEGFLGTRAPLFMDMVTLIVAALPLFMMLIIMLARAKKYTLHAVMQWILFVVSTAVVIYFEYGVRVGGGFDYFMEGSTVEWNYALVVLMVHIFIATLTMLLWFRTVFKAKKHLELGIHISEGKKTFLGVILTSFSGIWVYLLMFVF